MTQILTAKQLSVLRFLQSYREQNQTMPSRSEVARHFGWASDNSVDTHYQHLARKGYITLVPGKARNVRLTHAAMNGCIALPVLTMEQLAQRSPSLAEPGRVVR